MSRSKKPDRTSDHTMVSRRAFIAAGAGALAFPKGDIAQARETAVQCPRKIQEAPGTRLSPKTRTVHSVCLACNARCGVRGVVEEGRLINISGNPYHPYNMQFAPLPYDTPISEAIKTPSPLCGKALDTPEYINSPYRILSPLKRSGPRGSGRFEPIDWETLIREICYGGNLFGHLGEKRGVEGIKDLLSDDPISPEDPGLGPKRNGLVFLTGRLQSGRKEFIDRFVKRSVGSKNRIGHTDICGLGFRMGNFALTDKEQVELKADPKNAEYILVFGANIYEALQPGVNTYGAIVARRHADGQLNFSIADPRSTRASVHAQEWLPVKPGKDGALAMGMIRHLIETGRINFDYLSAPNAAEVGKRGFASPCNACHLVICDTSHPEDGAFLRMRHLANELDDAIGEEKVVFPKNQKTPLSAETTTVAALDRQGEVRDASGNTMIVKTAFRLLKESAMEYSMGQYSEFCGVPEARIKRVAKEFSSHGTRAAITQYHGAGNYTNGTYAAYAIASLNALVGSVGMKGGYLNGGGGVGKPDKGIYDLKSFPGEVKAKGVAISREKAVYESSQEYRSKKKRPGTGYPAKRPWFAFTKGGLCVEALSGIDQRYPYPAKVLFTYLFNPVYSIPGGYRFKETLADADKVPLHISIDIAINESNLYADYIVPDLTFAEGHYGWLTPHAPGLCFTGIRSPMIAPKTRLTPDGRPICTETLLIDIAEKLKLPGFGAKVIADSSGKLHDLNRAEDFYLRAFANIAENAGLAPADDADTAYVTSAYPLAEHKDILPPKQWRSVCRMLSRGGVFKPYDAVFDGNIFAKAVPEVHLYNEALAQSINSITGERFSGTPVWMPPTDAGGQNLDDLEGDYPFAVVTYKHRLHTQSRSLWSTGAMEICGENRVEIHSEDCRKLNLAAGDRVKLISQSNRRGITGIVAPTRLIRPGCIAVSFHFGHSQFGGSSLTVKHGETVFAGGKAVMQQDQLIPDPALTRGLNFNDVALLDPHMERTPLVDQIGGIPDFSSTRVAVVKVPG